MEDNGASFISPPTPPPDKNGRYFVDNFNHIFLNENLRISIQLPLKGVPRGPLDNESALVRVMAWSLTDYKPLHEPMLAQFSDAYMHDLYHDNGLVKQGARALIVSTSVE